MLMTWGWGHTAVGPLLMTPVPHPYPHPEGVTSARRVPSELVTWPPCWVHNLHRVNVTVNDYTYFLLTFKTTRKTFTSKPLHAHSVVYTAIGNVHRPTHTDAIDWCYNIYFKLYTCTLVKIFSEVSYAYQADYKRRTRVQCITIQYLVPSTTIIQPSSISDHQPPHQQQQQQPSIHKSLSAPIAGLFLLARVATSGECQIGNWL